MTRRQRERRLRDERDIEIADFLDEYADAVRNGLTVAPNRNRHPEAAVSACEGCGAPIVEAVRGPLVVALKGLASSIRAGLVDSILDEAA